MADQRGQLFFRSTSHNDLAGARVDRHAHHQKEELINRFSNLSDATHLIRLVVEYHWCGLPNNIPTQIKKISRYILLWDLNSNVKLR